jgi:hypothetical protein
VVFSTVQRNRSYAKTKGISFLVPLADEKREKPELNKRISVESVSYPVSKHIKRN